ncbi:MAG: CDP-diacylglycerol--serine O-phosphatidyltransferase, partial [Thioalkalivibrio sp.]|nr:CDP-diacylglycerol--serine O-phosphatidyltransferase [Thioalkalivibrio sp.]
PSPASAAVVVGTVWVAEDMGMFAGSPTILMGLALIVTVLAGVLMVSNLAYFSFKDMDFRHRVPFFAMLAVVGVLMLAALDPPKVLLACFVLYALSGPLLTLERWRRHRRRRS